MCIRDRIEGVRGVRVEDAAQIQRVWEAGELPVLVDPAWGSLKVVRPDVLVDAILAKRNLGTRLTDAPLVIGLGPGFEASKRCV